jgi:hypothetical protein
MKSRINTLVIEAFIQGKARKIGSKQSTGQALYLHGNKIAEYKDGFLHISNGDYPGKRGETGSKTTKEVLNKLPGINIHQFKFEWYLRGEKWDGTFIKTDTKAPEYNTSKIGDVFDKGTEWENTGGYRGFCKPKYAIAGANDTGMWSDSPCPSNVSKSEIETIQGVLKSAGIDTIIMTTETSNIFCVHHYLIAKVKDFEKAKEIVTKHIEETETRLLYVA